MNPGRPLKLLLLCCCVATLATSASLADSAPEDSFRAILEQVGIRPKALSQLGERSDYEQTDWQTLLQVLHRLQQFRDFPIAQIDVWPADKNHGLGELYSLQGKIIAVEMLELPGKVAELHDRKFVYRYQLQTSVGQEERIATILSDHIPKSWQSKQTFQEPVRVKGVLASISEDDKQLTLLTDHLAWYPTAGALGGQLLLANLGMDVALLDEVVQRQPFVKASVSREGEAFYEALLALSKVNQQQLTQLTAKSITQVADQWLAQQPDLERNHRALQQQLRKETDDKQQALLQTEIKTAKLRRGLAAIVLDRRDDGFSAVAPLFLQPEQEVGQLVRLEGIARRAVQISLADRSDLKAYYEVEVFTPDSQNLPVTFCATQLPEGFPTGDEIRESVQITGVFFKSWRYRSRSLTKNENKPNHQRQMFTPIVLGKTPTWIKRAIVTNDSPWAFWSGVAFLVGIALLWAVMAWLSRRDRQARAALRRDEKIDL